MFPEDEDDLFAKEDEEFEGINDTEKEKQFHFAAGVLNDILRYSGYNVLATKHLNDFGQEFNIVQDSILFAVSKFGKQNL